MRTWDIPLCAYIMDSPQSPHHNTGIACYDNECSQLSSLTQIHGLYTNQSGCDTSLYIGWGNMEAGPNEANEMAYEEDGEASEL